jgi:hypothetical protein
MGNLIAFFEAEHAAVISVGCLVPVGAKKLLLCELLHRRMGSAELIVENYGGAIRPLPLGRCELGWKIDVVRPSRAGREA